MLTAVELRRAVDLQQRSYRLLRWMGEAIPKGIVSFDRVHRAVSAVEAAADWVGFHYQNIPIEARPPSKAPDDLAAFANMLTSYLETSFDLVANPRRRLVSDCGCYCSYCAHMAAGQNLRTKSLRPTEKR